MKLEKRWLVEGRETGKCSHDIWQTILFYENVVNDTQNYYEKEERERLMACNTQLENKIIDLYINESKETDVCVVANVFQLLAERAFGFYCRMEWVEG